MFCKVCGEKNNKESLYCSNDGVVLHSDKKDFIIKNGNFSFCRECGKKVLNSDIYCGKCGSSLYNIEKTKKIISDDLIKEVSVSSKMDIRELIKFASIGTGLMFLISIIASGMINSRFVESFSTEIGFDLDLKILNFLDALVLFNAPSLELSVMSFGQSLGSLSIEGMVFFITMIPITIFTLLGAYVSMKKNKKELIKEYIFIGLFYSIIISIFSIFASRDLQVDIPYGLGASDFEMVNVAKKYGFLSLFAKSFIISSFSMFFGNGIYNFFKEWKSKNFTSLSVASIILGISMVFTFLATMIFTRGEMASFGTMGGIENMGASVARIQVFIYSLILANMGTFKIGLEGEFERVSILNNKESLVDLDFSTGYLYLALFLTIGLFFLYGRNSKKRKKEMSKIFYSPAIFASGITILTYIIGFKISIDYMSAVSFGSSYMLTFVGSFLISLLGSLAGYFLTGNQGGQVEANE